MKNVPFTEVPAGQPLDAAPPDGVYVTITHLNYGGPFTAYGNQKSTFPWSFRAYQFEGGLCDELGFASYPGFLATFESAHAYLVGLDPSEREELDTMLAEQGMKLVPD